LMFTTSLKRRELLPQHLFQKLHSEWQFNF
jgi:hypothetical protein